MIKAVIFDFFGVIGLSTYQLVGEKYNLSDTQKKELTDLHKTFDNGFIDDAKFLQSYADIISEPYESFIDNFYKSQERFRVSDAMIEFALELKKSYKIGMLSNVSSDAYHAFIEPIASNFDSVVTSYHAQLAKPDVAIFELIAQELGVDVFDCIMIDDSETNCEGARAAGMQAICHTSLADTRQQLISLVS